MLVYLMLIEDEGEKCKFKALYSKYERLMFHVARRILRNETDTEDAVQEAFFEGSLAFEDDFFQIKLL